MDITYTKPDTFKIKGKKGIATITNSLIEIESIETGKSRKIERAGEYEISAISVVGVKTEEGNVFIYEVDGFRICNLGKITKKLNESKLSQLGEVDILLLPVIETSTELMQQFDSYYVIPFGDNSDDIEKFLSSSGMTVTRTPKLSLKKENILEDQTTEIVLLESK